MQALTGSENTGTSNCGGLTEQKTVVKMTGNNDKSVPKGEIEQEQKKDGNKRVNKSENGTENKPSNSGDKSSVPKQPKRSYGNGFLVSADDEDRQDNVNRHKTEQRNVTNSDVEDNTKLTDEVMKDNTSESVQDSTKLTDEVIQDNTSDRKSPIRSISQPQTSNSRRKSKVCVQCVIIIRLIIIIIIIII